MALPTAADVYDGLVALWAADADLSAGIPTDRIYTTRDAERTDIPRAVIDVQDDSEERLVGRTVLVAFTATVTVYDAHEPPRAGAVLTRVLKLFTGGGVDLAVDNATKVFPVRRLPGGTVASARERVQGTEVASAAARLRVACEAKR